MARYVEKSKRKDWVKIRIRLLSFLFLLGWAGLWARAYHVQIVQGPELSAMANRQYWALEQLEGRRGEIFDRKGRLLAKSVEVQSVYARPVQVEDVSATAGLLAKALGQPRDRVARLLKQRKSFVWVARTIGDKEAGLIRAAHLPGIYLTAESRRFYPQGHLAGQLIGFVGIDGHGLEGLEQSFDSLLTGKRAENLVQKDASGHRLYASGQDVSGIAGQDLFLTIDTNLQFAAEEVLAEAVRSSKGRWGTCLMVEVKTGDILAWAAYPFFNPNNFQSAVPAQWRNRIVLDAVEPGSTMKPLLVAAALEEGIVDRNSIYFCENGKWRHAGINFKDTHEYGWLPVHKIIRYSSNIGAAKIGLAVGASKFHDYLMRFGFGHKTGLPVPGENKGLVRPPQAWTEVDLVASSFGQSVSMTAAQLAKAYLCLASKGVSRDLRLVRDATSSSSAPQRVVSEATATAVLGMLAEVVEANGTGTQARIEGVRVGGKTGTAQKASKSGGYGDEYLATFVGLLPADDPEYLIVVMVDEPSTSHYGGVVAAPVMRELAVKTLAYYGGLPDQEGPLARDVHAIQAASEPGGGRTVRRVADRSVTDGSIPDLRGLPLRRAIDILAGRGVQPRLKGEGLFVVDQSPAPDVKGSGDKEWTLWLAMQPKRSRT